MIKITKNEAMEIRRTCPGAHIVETSKSKPAKARTYYMVEEARLVRKLKELRGNSD